MKKKPARQPRKIEVVEDAPVATAEPKTKATKAKATKSTKTKPAPTDATPAVVDQPAAQPQQNATVAKSGAKKGKGKAEATAAEPAPAATKRKTKKTEPATEPQSERKPEQPSTIARVEGKIEGKLSAIDAAAKVLETSGPLNCKELIGAMSAAGLWTSPGGKTPHATLYSAILREITVKGDESRFVKTERGRFAKR